MTSYVTRFKSKSTGEVYTIKDSQIDTKQDVLVSGENIKTINNQSILGDGNIEIGGGTVDYDQLDNRPQIAGVTLTGNKSADDLGLFEDTRGEALEDQLYDTEVIQHNELTYNHTTSRGARGDSTYIGWAGTIGHPRYIHKIVIPFTVRPDKPVSAYKIGLFKLTSEITDDDFVEIPGSATNGLPCIGTKIEKVLEKTVILDEPITTVGMYNAEFVLDEQIDNVEGNDYILEFQANNYITYGYDVAYSDPMKSGYCPGIGWNANNTTIPGPWENMSSFVTEGLIGKETGRYNFDLNVRTSKQNGIYHVATAKIYGDWTEISTGIHTDKDSKFTGLVKDSISDSLDEVSSINKSVDYLNNTLEDESTEIVTHQEYTHGRNTSYSTSTFCGWYGAIGHPEKVNYAKLKITFRGESYPVTQIRCKMYVLKRPITIDDYDKNPETGLPTGNPKIGGFLEKVLEVTKTFAEPIKTTEQLEIEFEFPETYDNINGYEMIAGYECNNYITSGYFNTNVASNRPWDTEKNVTGPWIGYCTYNSTGTYSTLLDYIVGNPNGTMNMAGSCWSSEHQATPAYAMFADADIGWKETVTHGEINTTEDAKFTGLVNEVIDTLGIQEKIDNAQAASQLVEPVRLPIYQGYSNVDLVSNPTTGYSWLNPNSTFTGETQPIGTIPASVDIGGFRVPFKIRSLTDDNGKYNKATKAGIQLWECNFTMINDNVKWDNEDFGATLVREKIIDIDLDLDDPEKLTGVFDFYFDEVYHNTSNKHLYLTVWLGARFYRTITNKLLLTYLNTNYDLGLASVKSFYSTKICPATPDHTNSWKGPYVFAYSIIKPNDTYVASDTFNEWVDDRTETTITEEVEDYLSHHSLPVPPSYEVRLAKKYYAVVGDKLQLFYDGLVKGINPSDTADIAVRCDVGRAYPRYWEYTPTAAAIGKSYTFNLYVRNLQGEFISQGTSTIEVVDVPTYSTETTYNMLCFGDSLTASGYWCAEGIRRLVGTSTSGVSGPASLQVPNLVLSPYGKKSNTVNTQYIRHEGYAGWTWGSFLQTSAASSTVNGIYVTLNSAPGWDINVYQHSIWIDQNDKQWKFEEIDGAKIKFDRGPGNTSAQSATELPTILDCTSLSQSIASSDIASTAWESGNPFYDNTTNRINFVAHAQELDHAPADIVSILLTWNGFGSNGLDFNHEADINAHIANATTLIRDIHSDLPNTKVICMGIQLPSITGGSGANYGATGSYGDQNAIYYCAYDYNKALEELVTNEEFGSYCYYCDTKGQFDTKYLMPYEQVAVNTRSSVTEPRGTNGVHPSTGGYYAIGDAYFRTLVKVLNDIKE